MRLKNWTIWPIPIVLDISKNEKINIEKNKLTQILLKDKNDKKIAVLKNIEIYDYCKKNFAQSIYKTNCENHPWINYIYNLDDFLIWWKIEIIEDIIIEKQNFFSPEKTRKIFQEKGWKTVVAFQTRNPPHVSHEYLQKCALESCDWLFINPVVWKKKKWDFKDKYILWAYKLLIKNYFKSDHAHLSTLPISMKYAWPREAILHAIIRQNFWCSHIIIGRDHAGIWDYYWTYDAQNIFDFLWEKDINIKVLKYENAWHCCICNTVTTNKTCPHSDEDKMHISWTKVREKIKNKEILPSSFMRKEISEYLIEWNDQFVK